MEWLLLAAAGALMLACGVFVAAEFAFVAVDRSAVDTQAAAGDKAAEGVQRALRSLSTQLSGAQVGITVTNLAIGFLAEPAIASLVRTPLQAVGVPTQAVSGVSLAIGLVLATAATMVIGELVPKNLAIATPLRTAKATQLLMRGFTRSMAVPIRILNGSANALVRRLGIEPQEELRSARSPAELSSLARRSAADGTLDQSTATLVQRSVAFSGRVAGEIMTPRVRMSAIDATATVADLINLADTTGHSRFPVVERGSDDVIGGVHVKSVVDVPAGRRDQERVRSLMVPAATVPWTLPLDPLLRQLRGQGFHLAVVADEYGGTSGVVTIEDVVEEIVGDIADEHDRLHADARRLRDGSWSLSGLLRPDEVQARTGVALPPHPDYRTVAGLVLRLLGRIPVAGDAVTVALAPVFGDDGTPHRHAATLTVNRMEGQRIDRVGMTVDEVPHG